MYSLNSFEKPNGDVFTIEKVVYKNKILIKVTCVFLKFSMLMYFLHKYPIPGRKLMDTAVSNLHSIREYKFIKTVKIIENAKGSMKIL